MWLELGNPSVYQQEPLQIMKFKTKYPFIYSKCLLKDTGVVFLTWFESMATRQDNRNYCFQVQDVKDGEKRYIDFMGRCKKGG